MQVFGREDSFDPRTDPIVRVQARRLRARLDRYYREEGHADDVVDRAAQGRLHAVVPPPRGHRGAARLARRGHGRPQHHRRPPHVDCSPGSTLGAFCRGLADEIVHRLVERARGCG